MTIERDSVPPSVRHGEYKMPGGKLVVADIHVHGGVIELAQISGDFFLEPDHALGAINQALCGLPASADEAELAARVRAALAPEVSMYGLSPEAVAVAVRRALDAGAGA
jgi:lipoate-protein ligase A